MSTNTGGGAGTGSGGGSGTGPRIDRFMAYWDGLVEKVIARMGQAIVDNDPVARADERSRIDDLRIAYHLTHGRDVAELDRNGWPVTS